MKKVVVFGGGTGLSCLLSGLKLFPVDVTTVIAVSDDGSSTGVLKRELDIPAVGDVGKVLLSMANVDDDFLELLHYRFAQEGSLHNHPVRNILLAALVDLKGNLAEATRYMCRLLNIKGTVLPLTEERVDLVGEGSDRKFYGEEEVSRHIRDIRTLTYDHEIHIQPEIEEKILDADLVIFSPGSLYTSIIPHLLSPEILSALERTEAPLMYVSNLVTQPGETDDPTLSSHIKVLNGYLVNRKIDIAIANDTEVDPVVSEKYLATEGKKIVRADREALSELNVNLISDHIFCIENGTIRHNALKTAFLIFSWLMEQTI